MTLGRVSGIVAAVFAAISVFSLARDGSAGDDPLHYVGDARPPDDWLALRTEPTARSGRQLMKMPNGTQLRVLQRRNDGWWYVRVIGTNLEGWALNRVGNRVWIHCCVQAVASAPVPTSPAVAVSSQNPISTSLPPAPIVRDGGRRVALVIGNSGYREVAELPNPRHDAAVVAAALRRTGFQSAKVENDLSRERLIEALRAFAREAEMADWAVVYFAGHGIEMNGANYLIPVDAKLEIDRDVEFEAVSLGQVLSAVEGASKLRLVLLDACRDNPFAKRMRRTVASRSLGRGLGRVEPDAGTLIVYAAKHGEIALDGTGVNSPFASALVKYLGTPGIEIGKLFRLVSDEVMDTTKRRQEPFTYGRLSGREDFYFVR
jgi:hypothetical protein